MAETRTNGVASSINGKPELQPIKVGQVYDNIPTALSPTVSSATTGVDKFDEIIPHPDEVPHRNLVLCFDGTGDQFSSDNSNVVAFFSMLKREDAENQLVYYQAGIGTYTIPELVKPWMSNISKTLDMMLGSHLDAHIMGGYEFLMQNFKTGDKIFIFGFSRGAYTARALAGMIHKIGLLPPSNHQQVPFAYQIYATEDNWGQSNEFKRTFSVDVDIEFVGVWDTVSSVGVFPRRLPFTGSNNHIRYFRHAISLDERRARFKVNLWNRRTDREHNLGVQKGTMPRHKTPPKMGDNGNSLESSISTKSALKREYSEPDRDKPTDTEEVWFSGCHGDIGGGCVDNDTRHSLARIPLRWMLRQCFEVRTGILFYKHMFKDIGMDPHSVYPHVRARPPAIPYTPDCLAHNYKDPINFAKANKGTIPDHEPFISEEQEDLLDSLTPVYDQLRFVMGWWVLEVLPYKHVYQKADNKWQVNQGINLGRPRIIPRQLELGVKVHRTVKTRMEAPAPALFKDTKYEPAAKLDVEPTWVA